MFAVRFNTEVFKIQTELQPGTGLPTHLDIGAAPTRGAVGIDARIADVARVEAILVGCKKPVSFQMEARVGLPVQTQSAVQRRDTVSREL